MNAYKHLNTGISIKFSKFIFQNKEFYRMKPHQFSFTIMCQMMVRSKLLKENFLETLRYTSKIMLIKSIFITYQCLELFECHHADKIIDKHMHLLVHNFRTENMIKSILRKENHHLFYFHT